MHKLKFMRTEKFILIKILVIANSDWSIKNVYRLDASLYNQPEGIAFDKDNNLYISNE